MLAHFHPERAARVLLGAHYDTRPRADCDTGLARSRAVPGANDGASGVAVLLEVASALATWDPGIGVDLVFFDGEDYGQEDDLEHYLLGSRHFVRTMGAYRPRAMLLLDMVGDADLRIPKEKAPHAFCFADHPAFAASRFCQDEGSFSCGSGFPATSSGQAGQASRARMRYGRGHLRRKRGPFWGRRDGRDRGSRAGGGR